MHEVEGAAQCGWLGCWLGCARCERGACPPVASVLYPRLSSPRQMPTVVITTAGDAAKVLLCSWSGVRRCRPLFGRAPETRWDCCAIAQWDACACACVRLRCVALASLLTSARALLVPLHFSPLSAARKVLEAKNVEHYWDMALRGGEQ